MKNIKLTLEYDGTRYNGWQRLGKGEDVYKRQIYGRRCYPERTII